VRSGEWACHVLIVIPYSKQLISLWIWEHNVSPRVWISYPGIWSITGDLYLYNFALAFST
jgi:hypothetical protein